MRLVSSGRWENNSKILKVLKSRYTAGKHVDRSTRWHLGTENNPQTTPSGCRANDTKISTESKPLKQPKKKSRAVVIDCDPVARLDMDVFGYIRYSVHHFHTCHKWDCSLAFFVTKSAVVMFPQKGSFLQ